MLRTFALITAALSLSLLAPGANAQQQFDPVSGENVSVVQAKVVRVDPVYETVRIRTPEERCDGEEHDKDHGRGGAIVGAVVGGVAGNQVGKGDGKKVATVAGAVIGGLVGRKIDRENSSGNVPVCRMVEVEREERRIAGYDVEYTYQGKTYMSRMPYDPGDTLSVRITVSPIVSDAR